MIGMVVYQRNGAIGVGRAHLASMYPGESIADMSTQVRGRHGLGGEWALVAWIWAGQRTNWDRLPKDQPLRICGECLLAVLE